MQTWMTHIEGMTCEGCAASVRKALRGLGGLVSAEIDVASGAASLTFDQNHSAQVLRDAIEGAGFDVVGDLAERPSSAGSTAAPHHEP
jgi:copper chaperone